MDGIEAMAAELVRKYFPHFRGWAKAVPAGEGDGGPLPPLRGKPVYEGKKTRLFGPGLSVRHVEE